MNPPTPNDTTAFWRPDWGLERLGVRMHLSFRSGGVSQAPYDSLNLGLHVGDDPLLVHVNRGIFQEHLGVPAVFMDQKHGIDILEIGPSSPSGLCADAAFTTHAGVACTMMVADCMPLLLADEKTAALQGLTPRARVVGMATAGVPPRVMGIGPAPATEKVMALTGLTLAQMDVIELNEAFAAQGLAVLRMLGLSDDDARVNPNGGAIALGHPLGASGGRLVTTAINQLHRTGGRYALCTMCIGVGQGIALVIERV